MDGALLPEHAGDRRRDRVRGPDVRGHGGEVRRSLPRHRQRAEPGRSGLACGTKRMASTTTSCGCRTGRPRGSRCDRSSGCCRSARRPSSSRGSASACRRSPRTSGSGSAACRSCCAASITTGEGARGYGDRGLMAVVNEQRLRRILEKMLDEQEFLSPYGIRALSRVHQRPPVRLPCRTAGVSRGLPAGRIRQRDVRRQLQLAGADLDADERAAHPRPAAVLHVLRRLLHRRVSHRIGPRDEPVRGGAGARHAAHPRSSCATSTATVPCLGGTTVFQTDPHWRDHLLFYEYFHGDNGAGLGASHQTGWTGLVGVLIQLFGKTDAKPGSSSVRPAPRPSDCGTGKKT